MSRRTKLIILGMLLLLALVPVGYIALSWDLHEPLRFRVNGRVDAPGVHHDRVEVVNASGYPVRIYTIDIMDPENHDAEIDYLEPEAKIAGQEFGIARLPARGTMISHGQQNTNLKLGGLTARCRWNSETKHKYCATLHWLSEKLPEWLVEVLPEPSMQTTDALVEPQPQALRK